MAVDIPSGCQAFSQFQQFIAFASCQLSRPENPCAAAHGLRLHVSPAAGVLVHLLIDPWFWVLALASAAVKPLIWFTVWRLPVTWSKDDQGLWQPTWQPSCGEHSPARLCP